MSDPIRRIPILSLVLPILLAHSFASEWDEDAGAPGPPAAALTSDVMSAEFGSFGCVVMLACVGGQHRMTDETPWGEFTPDLHPCNPPPLHSGPPCPYLAFTPEQALVASLKDLKLMLAASGTNVLLNRDRKALQVRGCDEHILASFPLDPEAIAFLEE